VSGPPRDDRSDSRLEVEPAADGPSTEDAELAAALRAAHTPEDLSEEQLEALLERALASDPLAEASELELRQAERLRTELSSDPLIMALRSAVAPTDPDPERHERLVAQALERHRSPSGRLFVWIGVTASALGVAAAVALVVRTASTPSPRAAEALARSRSTASLFSEPFERAATTERIDRIAEVRARELRQNRFHSWGVR